MQPTGGTREAEEKNVARSTEDDGHVLGGPGHRVSRMPNRPTEDPAYSGEMRWRLAATPKTSGPLALIRVWWRWKTFSYDVTHRICNDPGRENFDGNFLPFCRLARPILFRGEDFSRKGYFSKGRRYQIDGMDSSLRTRRQLDSNRLRQDEERGKKLTKEKFLFIYFRVPSSLSHHVFVVTPSTTANEGAELKADVWKPRQRMMTLPSSLASSR